MRAYKFGDSIVSQGEWEKHEKMVLNELKRLGNTILAMERRHVDDKHNQSNKIAKLELTVTLLKNNLENMEKQEEKEEGKNYQLILVLIAVFANLIWNILEKYFI